MDPESIYHVVSWKSPPVLAIPVNHDAIRGLDTNDKPQHHNENQLEHLDRIVEGYVRPSPCQFELHSAAPGSVTILNTTIMLALIA